MRQTSLGGTPMTSSHQKDKTKLRNIQNTSCMTTQHYENGPRSIKHPKTTQHILQKPLRVPRYLV